MVRLGRFIGRVFLCAYLSCAPDLAFADVVLTVHPAKDAAVIDDPEQMQQNIRDIPGNATLVDDRDWSDQRATTIKDITDYVPGVIAEPRNGAESMRLSLRGSGLANIFQGSGLLVLQDGIPINMADGEFEFPVIDPWLIRYAEIFPGANALDYGTSTFGGAINFVTPTGATTTSNLRLEGGSFNTLHGQVAGGEVWKNGDIFAAGTGFTQEGFRQNNRQETGRINGNWGWQPNDHFINRVYINHTISDAEIPGAISKADISANPTQANPLNRAGDYQRNLDITRIADRSEWRDADDSIDTTIFYTYRTLDNPVTTYEVQQNNDEGVRVKYTHHYGQSDWGVGINSMFGNADESRFQNIAAVKGAHILDRNLDAATNEAYGQIEQKLFGKVFGIIGAQAAYDARNLKQTFPSIASQNKNYSGFSPRIGLRWDIEGDNQLFTNLSRSFEPPSWQELSGGNSPGFRSLKAQRATTLEIGARGTVDALHWQAAVYHGWLRDEFVDYRFEDGTTDTVNAPRTQKDGIELGLEGDLGRDLWLNNDAVSVRTAYTYNHFTLDHDRLYGNNILPGVPEHYLRAEILYHHPFGISLGPNVEASPSATPVDLANSLYASSYAVLGARAYWESNRTNLSIYIEGRNLTDAHYAATNNVIPDAGGRDGRYFYPGEGRAVYAGMSWGF